MNYRETAETELFKKKLAKHEEICRGLHELYEAKNADYGDSVGKTYQDFGVVSFATRISDKYNRMVELVKGHQPKVNDEKLVDTFRDMANYCLLAVLELEMEEENETD